MQEGSQWLHVRDFDRLLRESQREVLRLQRQIALRNQQEPPPPARPSGPPAQVRAGASAARLPGEVSTGARAGVWVCVDGGRGQFQDLPLKGAQSPEGPVVAHGLQGLGSFPDSRDGVPRPASQRSYLLHARPWGFGFRPPQACAPGTRPTAPATVPVVRPGRKSLVALAATLGPARPAASRRRLSAGTPPSAPAW